MNKLMLLVVATAYFGTKAQMAEFKDWTLSDYEK